MPTLEQIGDTALAEAARHTGLPASSLKLLSAEAVTWADGSLGCPDPKRLYTMALVPGFRVRVQAGGQTLDYHADARGRMLLCPAGRAVDPAPGNSRI